MELRGYAFVCTFGTLVGCIPGSFPDESVQAVSVTHSFNLASQMPAHLSLMLSVSWFGIPGSDPQGAGPDQTYANSAISFSCEGVQSDPSTCDTCILKGTGGACLQSGAAQRNFASRRKPLAGIYSASARDLEGRRRVGLMLSTLRRPCDSGARIDSWAVQLDGTRNTSLYPGNTSCSSCDIAYRALTAFLEEADEAQLAKAVLPADDATWYFHFGSAVGLGSCDDSSGNAKQRCVDALTQDFVDMTRLADAHASALRVDGSPVFLVYIDGHLTPQEWQSLLQNARNTVGHDFYVVAAVLNPSSSATYFSAFDALAPWVQLAWDESSGSDVRTRARAYAAKIHDPLYSNVGLYPGRMVFGGVSPGFDDFTQNWGGCNERQLPPTAPRHPDFLTGEFDYLKDRSAAGLVLETWDDWTEGTEFEPDVAGGSSTLLALRQRIGELYGDAADADGDTRLVARWAEYGQARNCDGGTAGVPPAVELACPAPDGGAGDADAAPSSDGDGAGLDAGAAGGPADAAAPLHLPDDPAFTFAHGCGGCTVGGGPSPLPGAALSWLLGWWTVRAWRRARRFTPREKPERRLTKEPRRA